MELTQEEKIAIRKAELAEDKKKVEKPKKTKF